MSISHFKLGMNSSNFISVLSDPQPFWVIPSQLEFFRHGKKQNVMIFLQSLLAHRILRTSIERPAIQTRFVRFSVSCGHPIDGQQGSFLFQSKRVYAMDVFTWTSFFGQKLDILRIYSLRPPIILTKKNVTKKMSVAV